MAYTGNYTSEDLDDIAIDGIGKAGVAIIAFITLIVVVAILVWLKKAWTKIGGK